VKLDLNAFNLATPFNNRIGIYLHPYAALINHSCDSNAVFLFDGDTFFVKALKPIHSGEQIFISYIDSTSPLAVRHKALSKSYHFNCECTKCVDDSHSPLSALEPAEEQAETLMGSDPDVNALKSALSVLRKTSAWPIAREPYILNRLIDSLPSVKMFYSGFALATLRFLQVDPVVFLHSHPTRQLHTWAFADLCFDISQGVDVCAEDNFPLSKFKLNFCLLTWSLFSRIVEKMDNTCITQRSKDKIRTKFHKVYSEYRRHSLDPATMHDEIECEWVKLGKVAKYAAQIEW
jgi:SET domain